MEHSSTTGGRVTVGAFVLDLAAPGGTRIYVVAPGAATDVTPLGEALNSAEKTIERIVEQGVEDADSPTAVEGMPESLEEASAFTDRVEQAVNLAAAISEGRMADAVKEIDGLFALSERLHRAGRYEDELRVLRALFTVLALMLRWLALIEVLRRALTAATAYADTDARGWVIHELGTLSLVSGDKKRGVLLLEEAQRLRRATGDERGLEATTHNLARATTTRRTGLRFGRRPEGVRVVLAAVAAVILLCGGVAIAVVTERGSSPLAATTTRSHSNANAKGSSGNPTGTSSPSASRSSTPTSATRPATSTATATTTTPKPVGSATFSATPSDPTRDGTASFSFSAANANGFRCQLDGGAATMCDHGTWNPGGALADGSHQFAVWGVAGNQKGPTATYSWLIDATPPSVSILRATAGAATYTITDSGSGPAAPTCEVTDSAGQIAGSVTSCTLTSARYTGLTHGTAYTFTVTAFDAAGNSASAQQPFTA